MLVLSIVATIGQVANAGISSRVVREGVEFTARKFGKEVAEEGLEKLSTKMAGLAAKHGDEVVSVAFSKVGPRAGKLASEAGEQADVALRMLARHGDEGISLVTRPASLKMISQFGDDGAEALLRHGAVGEQLIGEFAEGGVKALNKVTAQNGRRLAMLAGDNALKPQLIDVICNHGDRACEFIWKNKGALAAGTTLAVFLANPEPFLDGTVQLTEIVADAAVRPLAEEAGRHYGGTMVLAGLLIASLIFAARLWFKRGIWGLAGGWLIRRGKSYFDQPSSKN
jgi:hypothetical protein